MASMYEVKACADITVIAASMRQLVATLDEISATLKLIQQGDILPPKAPPHQDWPEERDT